MSEQLERVARAVQRRMWLRRAVIHARNAILVGCVLAMLIGAAQWWRGQNAFPAVAVIFAITLIAAAIQAWRARVSIWSAVVEADNLLECHDLLPTAWTMKHARPGETEDWAAIIIKQAGEFCECIDMKHAAWPSPPIRSLAGAGLLAVLISFTTLAVGNSPAGRSEGATAGRDGGFMTAAEFDRDTADRGAFPSIQRRQNDATRAESGDTLAQDSRATHQAPALLAHNGSAGRSSSGAGGGQSTDATHAVTSLVGDIPNASHDPVSIGNETRAATGAGISRGMEPGSASIKGQADANSSNDAISAWSSRIIPAHSTGDEAATAHPVPPEYRDLVRAYFERSN